MECYDYHMHLTLEKDPPKQDLSNLTRTELQSDDFREMAFRIYKDYLFHHSSKTSERDFHHASTYAIKATKHFMQRMSNVQ